MFSIDLTGKIALITGVNSGIGLGIAKEMAKAGAIISGCDVGEDSANFVDEMNQYQVEVLYTKCDVTSEDQLRQWVIETTDRFGKIDILVSNAGQNIFKGAYCDEKSWQKNMELNLASHWRLAKLCKAFLEKEQGVIIIVSSNHAFSTIPGCFPYNIAKTALRGLVRSLAIEWGPTIRTIGIAPGFIDTPGNQEWFDSFADPAAEREKTVRMHPVKKLGTMEEIGGWCVFLVSRYAAFASGTTYLIDGGRSALMQE